MESLQSFETNLESHPEQPEQKEFFEISPENNEEHFITELKALVEGREIFPTKEVLEGIIANTIQENLKEVASLLLSNEKRINESTIARGDTFNGQGIGQSIATNDTDNPLVQVVIAKGTREFTNIFKGETEFIPLEEDDNGEKYNTTVIHELLHSFTTYITSAYAHQREELLNDLENTFYANVLTLHKKFLEKNTTNEAYLDSLNEYIVKAMSSNMADMGMFDKEQYNAVFKEFKTLYMENPRHIQSISEYLKEKN